MPKVAIIRCEKNEDRCPLTSCFKSMLDNTEGFAEYSEPCTPAGIFTCRCPGDNAVKLSAILKSKGAEAIHFATCTFSKKTDGGWKEGNGFCDHIETLMAEIHQATGLPVVKGTAHLPEGYTPEVKK